MPLIIYKNQENCLESVYLQGSFQVTISTPPPSSCTNTLHIYNLFPDKEILSVALPNNLDDRELDKILIVVSIALNSSSGLPIFLNPLVNDYKTIFANEVFPKFEAGFFANVLSQ